MPRQRIRQTESRKPDPVDDQQTPAEIADEASSLDGQSFLSRLISQLRRAMGTENWTDVVPTSLQTLKDDVAAIVAGQKLPPLSVVSDTNLALSDYGRRYDNRGASGPVTLQLPPSASLTVGWYIEVRVAASQLLTVGAQGGDVIQHDDAVTAAAGYMQSAFKGTCALVEYAGAGEFFVVEQRGTWDWSPGP